MPKAKKYRSYPVIEIVREVTGLTIQEFCEKELETQYPAFQTRLKRNKLYPTEIVFLVWRTGRTVEDLFGRPWHELLITDQGGAIAGKVTKIIESLTEEQKKNLTALLGFEQNKEKEAERHVVSDVPADIKEHPMTPDESHAPKEGLTELEKLFKKTY